MAALYQLVTGVLPHGLQLYCSVGSICVNFGAEIQTKWTQCTDRRLHPCSYLMFSINEPAFLAQSQTCSWCVKASGASVSVAMLCRWWGSADFHRLRCLLLKVFKAHPGTSGQAQNLFERSYVPSNLGGLWGPLGGARKYFRGEACLVLFENGGTKYISQLFLQFSRCFCSKQRTRLWS